MVVGADFPDEQYADFDEWAVAMASDDTDAPTSPLWHGGGLANDSTPLREEPRRQLH